jgi:prephenate dehydrogenase
MKILIAGAGKMGSWLVESLCLDHDVAVYDKDKTKLKYLFHAHRFISLEEIQAFQPELLINAVSLQHTIPAFREVLPLLPQNCIISISLRLRTG